MGLFEHLGGTVHVLDVRKRTCWSFKSNWELKLTMASRFASAGEPFPRK